MLEALLHAVVAPQFMSAVIDRSGSTSHNLEGDPERSTDASTGCSRSAVPAENPDPNSTMANAASRIESHVNTALNEVRAELIHLRVALALGHHVEEDETLPEYSGREGEGSGIIV